ncbi:MAG: class II fructose-bisphosphate aldolase [Nitrospirota bacterium]|nr:class II fructose-bisphosphate aldolase [Nitrospirota bacterium]
MSKFASVSDIDAALAGVITRQGNAVTVQNEAALQGEAMDRLVYNAVFADTAEVRGTCRWLIREIGNAVGCASGSIHGLYMAMGRGEVPPMTVPAVNIRVLTYDTARAMVRAAQKVNSGAFIFEIAKSEIGYTFQRPSEYAAVILAACLREGYRGPVFIQGDHFQVNAKKYNQDPEAAVHEVRELISEAIPAGFYNIDIDSSTLVDLAFPTVPEQQRHNFERAAELTELVRELEPAGITVSVGGEIGEVGEKNSTVEEFEAFMEGYNATLPSGMAGISKISVQTGTSHGGVPTADGSVAEVALDFAVLKDISKSAREKYHISGTVQHGASTLPDEAFNQFVSNNASEVHLATGFQNMIYDSRNIPEDLKQDVFNWLRENCADEMKDGQTEAQFLYKTRKKGFGPFRERFWTLPQANRAGIGQELEDKFVFLYEQLGVRGSSVQVNQHVKVVKSGRSLADEIACA